MMKFVYQRNLISLFSLLTFFTGFSQSNLSHTVKLDNEITSFSFEAGDDILIASSRSKIVKYSLGKHRVIQEINQISHVNWVKHTNDYKLLYVLHNNKFLSVFSADSLILQKKIELKHTTYKVLMVNNTQLLLLQPKGSISLFDLNTSEYIYTKTFHSGKIIDISIAPAVNQAVTIGEDNQLIVFSIKEGDVLQEIKASSKWMKAVSISPDGKFVVTGGQEKKIDLWNVKTGKLDKTYQDIQDGWIYNLKFDGSGKYFAATSDDLKVVLYSTKDLESKIVLTEFNYPVNQLAFKTSDTKLFTIEKYGKEIKIWDFYAGLKKDIVEEMSDEFSVISDSTDTFPPQIYLTELSRNTTNKIVTKRDMFDLHGVIKDESGILSASINGSEIEFSSSGKFTRWLLLSFGSNHVKIVATDGNNNVAVKEFEIYRKSENELEYDPNKAKNYLFVIGIDDYNNISKLNNAVGDAKQLVSVLNEKYSFDTENTTVLLNQDATKEKIMKELRNLIKDITPADNLLIYFAGHGIYDQVLDEGYWIPVEGEIGKPTTFLPNSVLKKAIENINSQHVLLIADACFSGALFDNNKRGYVDKAEQFKSRYAFTSGRLETVSDGEIGGASPFANLLIERLSNYQNKKLLMSNVEQYIKENFPEDSDQTPRFGPLRDVGDEGGEFVFYKKQN